MQIWVGANYIAENIVAGAANVAMLPYNGATVTGSTFPTPRDGVLKGIWFGIAGVPVAGNIVLAIFQGAVQVWSMTIDNTFSGLANRYVPIAPEIPFIANTIFTIRILSASGDLSPSGTIDVRAAPCILFKCEDFA